MISPIDLYYNFILKHFWIFSDKASLDHLKNIRDNILEDDASEEKEKKSLLNCLTNTEIVPYKDGTLKKASCYYDHTNEVFGTILTDDMFPPKPLNDERWMSFWKMVGLIHEVSIDLFKP